MSARSHGILVIDKPAGPTSFQVVQQVRRCLGLKKVGHLGTLDPFATGVLPLCLQEATRLTPFLLDCPKTYRATMRLGEATDTQDLTGTVISRSSQLPDPTSIGPTLAALVGEHWQTPPMYSAVQVQGRRLYQYARQGLSVAVPPRPIHVLAITLETIDLPDVTFTVTCSKGTYIRTLAADLGRQWGCGAHLRALRRLAVGPFTLEQAVPPPTATDAAQTFWEHLVPLAGCLPHLAAVEVDVQTAARLRHGQAVAIGPDLEISSPAPATHYKIICQQMLVAVVRLTADGSHLQPVRVFHADLPTAAAAQDRRRQQRT
ncbi:MAG: tRNA pseudouridine(55) synthase TruB [Desulfobacca sp.]|uniref:tRNA pseudouridine(55) synthase TruB n=1 Tax=Desulfobacca sp. TaxID=2067990 RepID=UPI00404A2D54